jgi:hypothetical protein
MPIIPDELINVLLQQLQQSAQRRPDLISDPRTQQVATYLGRVITPEDNPAEVQRRFPQAELETGGIAQMSPDLLRNSLIAGILARPGGSIRNIGLKRVVGYDSNWNEASRVEPFLKSRMIDTPLSRTLYPNEYIDQLRQLLGEPRFNRFVQGSQAQVASKLGPEFNIYRGLYQNEANAPLSRPMAFSTDPDVAKSFGNTGVVAVGRATPESILALVPSRHALVYENELIADPRKVNIRKVVRNDPFEHNDMADYWVQAFNKLFGK